MYNIVICEDDLIQRNCLKNFIETIFKEFDLPIEVFEFSSGEELLEINLNKIDIFFLDIQMDKLTGMDIAKYLRENNNESEIIFVTSLLDYIQEGYKVKAYRYLLKPIKFEDLRDHTLNCIKDISKKRDQFIILQTRGVMNKVLIKDIQYIEVRKKELTVHTKEENYVVKNSMEKLEKELKRYNFFRCHKSYLINIDHIQAICKNTVTIYNDEIPVSKHRISSLKTKLTEALGSVLC